MIKMFVKCQNLFQTCSRNLFLSPFVAQRQGLSKTVQNVTTLCRTRLNATEWQLRPFLRQCSRQVDYITAQKLKRGQQWIRFYSQLWSRDRLSSLLIQMGRKLGIALRHRKFSTLIFGGVALAPVDNIVSIDTKTEEPKSDNIKECQTSRTQNKR